MALTNETLLSKLKERFGEAIYNESEAFDTLSVETTSKEILNVVRFLYDTNGLEFQFLTDLTGVHYPENDKNRQLAVVYHLHSLVNNVRIRIKVFLSISSPRVASLVPVFLGANWMERETYDFFGIIFEGHPNLSRILNMDDMVAFPMRKEHPLEDPNRYDKDDKYFGR